MFEYTDLFGYVGSILCILSFLFQMYKVYKDKNAKSLSYSFLFLQLIVNVLYTIYNIIIAAIPLLLGNGTLVILIIILTIMKRYYDNVVPELTI